MKRTNMYKLTILSILLTIFSTLNAAENIPKRIVSLGSSITQQLYLLGVGDKIVGDTIYCNTPEDAKTKEKIGTIRSVNIEKIVRLKPDIVFATGMSTPKQVRLLQKMGLKVITIYTPRSFEGICKNFIKLGEITGRTEQAKKIVDQAKKDVTKLVKQCSKNKKKKVFFQIGVKPIFTVMGNTYLNDLIVYSGGVNIAEKESGGIYSREKVIAENPEVIILTTMGTRGIEEKKIWEKYPEISAVKTGSIYVLPADKICNPNPINFVENLKNMNAIINGKMK